MGRLAVIAILVWFLLSGCSAINWVKNGFKSEPNSKDLSIPEQQSGGSFKSEEDVLTSLDLVMFYESLIGAPDKEIQKHKNLAKVHYTEQKRLDKGLKYVLILILAGEQGDISEAKKVIARLKKTNDPDDFEGYKALMDLSEQLATQKSQYQDKLAKVQSQLEKREKELVILHDQLNALKSIDKNIHDREVGTIHDGR
jgi:hypothetical protein